MTGVLSRKLIRDLVAGRRHVVTVVAIIAVGSGLFIGLLSAQRILVASQAAYYEKYRLADFWVDVDKAPLAAAKAVARLPDVTEVTPRIVYDALLDVPGEIQPVTGRLVSVPPQGFDQVVNGIDLISGRGFSDRQEDEVILADPFARAHHLQPGDRFEVILDHRPVPLTVVGTAISPEYVFMVRGQGDFVPDPRHFGVLYIKEAYARKILGFRDSFNQLVGRVRPALAADTELTSLFGQITRLLEPYGVLGTLARYHQMSNRFLSDEIHGLGITAFVIPTIFLIVAVLVLDIVMTRFAERQRTIIGTLKALGYSDREVFRHYLSFGLAVGILGGVLGIVVGLVLARFVIHIFDDFFQFPAFLYHVYPDLFLVGMVLSIAFAVAGTFKGVYGILRLHPAEAMRPRPPALCGRVFLERFTGFWRSLSFRTHMALRSLVRNRGRTATGIIASCLAAAILMQTFALYDSMWFLVDFQFRYVHHGDLDISFRRPMPVSMLGRITSFPGVKSAEPVFVLVADVRNGPRRQRLSILGLAPGHRLTTPMQLDLKPIAVPASGLVLSRKAAELLEAKVGTSVTVRPVLGAKRTAKAPVVSIVGGFLGLESYADLRYLSRLAGGPEIFNGVQLQVAPEKMDGVFKALKQVPNIRGVTVRREARANIERTFIKLMTFTLGLTIVFAGIVAFSTLLNVSLIEVFDRRPEIVAFHVMGYRPIHIAEIFFRELVVLFVIGLALAVPVGWIMVVEIAKSYNTELFRMPVVYPPATILLAGGISVGFFIVVQIVIYRQIADTDMLEGIKARE